jgi:hypothetical protein
VVVAVLVYLEDLVEVVVVPVHNLVKILEFQVLQIMALLVEIGRLHFLVLEEVAQLLRVVLMLLEEVEQVEQVILGHSMEAYMRVVEEDPSVHHSVQVTLHLVAQVAVAQVVTAMAQEMVFQELLVLAVVVAVHRLQLVLTAHKATEDQVQFYLLMVASHNYLLAEQ